MPRLLENLQSDEILRTKLFGVEFISCKSGVLVTLLYHKKLDSEFESAMKILASKLDITILAISRGQKLLSGELNLIDELNVGGQIYKFSLSENAFIQPNRAVNEKMIAWAKECVQSSDDLLELYCGHGNFTIPLSFKFNNVLATEISKSSIANALKNCELNKAKNIKFLRMDADELVSAFAGVREFNRLKEINLSDFNFSHVLVDPPRAGLSESVVNFIKNFKNIIYISCNPETLKENLNELCKSHKVIKFAIFDQFANTHHIECGVLLRAKE
jgi:tRNA (uracil-5-)-methyltransferase